jgi:hypothetical protein
LNLRARSELEQNTIASVQDSWIYQNVELFFNGITGEPGLQTHGPGAVVIHGGPQTAAAKEITGALAAWCCKAGELTAG